MNLKDSIGKRGESIFTVLITKWCDGHPWFIDTFLGEKYETTDFMVELIEPTAGHAHFYVQVKSTRNRYTGRGASRKLDVSVTGEDVEKLRQIHAPVYVVGIDIDRLCGYIVAITEASPPQLSFVRLGTDAPAGIMSRTGSAIAPGTPNWVNSGPTPRISS